MTKKLALSPSPGCFSSLVFSFRSLPASPTSPTPGYATTSSLTDSEPPIDIARTVAGAATILRLLQRVAAALAVLQEEQPCSAVGGRPKKARTFTKAAASQAKAGV
ncbi:hypothetical protein BT69DRAFT_1296531 [Atractiella rhizophila]|nr:hypothetical protein BT69DRAFT_1296531 [Atractiella rhizophila]